MSGVLKLIAIFAVLFFAATGLMYVLELAPAEQLRSLAGRGFVVLAIITVVSVAVGSLIKEKQ